MGDPRIVPCDCCGTEGRIYRGQYEDEYDDGECPVCEGAGGELIETDPIELEDLDMMSALQADGEKLRQLTGKEHGPLCPRCHARPLDPIFRGSDAEGNICGECWVADRHAEWRDTEPR